MVPRTFDEFWPRYCGEHSRPATRWLHFAGTHAGACLLLAGLARHERRLLLAAPVTAYGVAWLAHALVEHNRPATFSHPLWSLRGDLRMIGLMWRGRDAEVQGIADDARLDSARPIVLAGRPHPPAA